MRKKMLSLLLAGVLALPLAACGGTSGQNSPAPPGQTAEHSTTPSQTAENSLPPEEPSPSPEPSWAVGLSLPVRDYRPWQKGYIDFLTQLRGEEYASESAYAAMDEAERETEAGRALWDDLLSNCSSSYSLYDVDEDGVPELFVKFGDFEAAYHTRCYTFRDGEMVLLGEFPSGHSSLYTYPGKNAFLLHRGHMGYAELHEYSVQDGKLTGGESLLTEENAPEYTEPGNVVPGAEFIDSFCTRMICMGTLDQLPPSLASPLLLPVCDWYDGPPATAAGGSSEQVRAAIQAVLEGDAPFTGVSGDGFYGDTGRTTWEAYIQPGAAYPYNEQPFQVAQYVWQDMNRDGQEECVVRLEAQDGEFVGLGDEATVVLSEQGGEVYAYYFGFYNHSFSLYTDGTIRIGSGAIATAMSFWKGQCYEYSPTNQHHENFTKLDEAAQMAEWIEATSAEG